MTKKERFLCWSLASLLSLNLTACSFISNRTIQNIDTIISTSLELDDKNYEITILPAYLNPKTGEYESMTEGVVIGKKVVVLREITYKTISATKNINKDGTITYSAPNGGILKNDIVLIPMSETITDINTIKKVLNQYAKEEKVYKLQK